MVDIFLIILLKLEIYCQGRFQKLSRLISWIVLLKHYIFFVKKLSNQIKNSNSINRFKIELDDIRNNGEKKNLSGYFWELSNELIKFDLYEDIVLIVYMF